MPLYHEWEPGVNALAAIWHIEEDEAFFQENTGLGSNIRHPRKRLEHLCGRWLLQRLREDFPLHHISPDEHDKPRLPENQYFFSISHSFPYVAAVVSEQDECGIDIQVWRERMDELSHMFLSDAEQDLLRAMDQGAYHIQGNNQQASQADGRMLTLAWCAKEAAYKWNGRRGVDFIEHLPIQEIVGVAPDSAQRFPIHRFSLEVQVNQRPFSLPAWIEKDFACACLLHRK